MSDQLSRGLDVQAIPDRLREREQWICWRAENRDGKQTKVPVDPTTGSFASTTDDRTWTSFEQALEYATTGSADGIGFVFTAVDPLVGVDLDDCRDPETGEPLESAPEIIDQLESFTEVSPSGTGYHVILEGELPDGRNRHGSIEMYDQARFFTVTADHVEGTPTSITERQDALEEIHEEFVAEDVPVEARTTDPPSTSEARSSTTETLELEDEALLEKARSASNGEKFDRLWRGSTAGYESQSEADMALCCLLAFWTGGARARMDQLFRQSGLLRAKWDEVHYADGSTYGEKTLERAVSNTSEFYDPESGAESTQDTPAGESASDTGRNESTSSLAYLTEKKRLLSGRLEELEATLERKNERIDRLETELKDLEAEHVGRDREARRASKEQTSNTDEGGEETETVSVWDRTKRLFGSCSEDR